MKHYTARAQRDGKWWAITVDGVKGAHSQARRLDQVEGNAREVISLMTGEDSFTVDVVQELPEEIKESLALFFEASTEATEVHRRLMESQCFAVSTLVGAGFSVRDVGSLMGISYQRVAQLADKS